ncbi:hypothetical protein ACVWXO_010988 [Bradyrhizobium sp. LM2.7]
MRSFLYQKATDPGMAVQALGAAAVANNPLTQAAPHNRSPAAPRSST